MSLKVTAVSMTELSIALLMEDAEKAKELAQILRSVGIFAQYYSALDEFWVVANQETPDLVIIDVVKMSFGSIQFKNHPKVLSGKLNYVFFSDDKTQFLLQSTLGLAPYGYLRDDVSLSHQMVGMMGRLRHEIELGKQVKLLEEKAGRLQTRSAKILADKSVNEIFKTYFDFIFQFSKDLEGQLEHGDFSQTLLQQVLNWDAVKAGGFYALSPNGQKLIAPQTMKKKYLAMPALWLGKDCQSGIEPFAQEMANQVARELFEEVPVELKVYGGGSHPDLLFYVEVEKTRLEMFPWDLLETLISGVYRRHQLSRQRPVPRSQVKPLWEALDRLDQMHYQQLETSEKSALITLVPLMNLIRKKMGNRFYYTAFFNDFFVQMSDRLHLSTQFSFAGPWHLIFFIQAAHLEQDFTALKVFIREFPYWKYFEDESRVLSEEIYPTIRILAPSSVHYLRQLEKEFGESTVIETHPSVKRTKTISQITL